MISSNHFQGSSKKDAKVSAMNIILHTLEEKGVDDIKDVVVAKNNKKFKKNTV